MDLDIFVEIVNDMSLQRALGAVTQLRDQASQQASWQQTPQNSGFPILRQIPEPDMTIDKVRGNLQNTEQFCNDVLKALGQEIYAIKVSLVRDGLVGYESEARQLAEQFRLPLQTLEDALSIARQKEAERKA